MIGTMHSATEREGGKIIGIYPSVVKKDRVLVSTTVGPASYKISEVNSFSTPGANQAEVRFTGEGSGLIQSSSQGHFSQGSGEKINRELENNSNAQKMSSSKDSLHTQNNQPTVTQTRTSETIIEHPPIIKGIFERPSTVYTNILAPQTTGMRYSAGQPIITGYSSVTEKTVNKREASSELRRSTFSATEDSFANQRLRERNEELLSTLHRIEGQDKETIAQLRRLLDTYHNRLLDLEEKYRKTVHERDELGYKLENSNDTVSRYKDRVAELEFEIKAMKSKNQKMELDNSGLLAERSELEVKIRRLETDLSSAAHQSDLFSSEANNRVKILEEKNRHLEKRLLDMEDDMIRLSKEYKEYRDKFNSSSHTQQTVIDSKILRVGIPTVQNVQVQDPEGVDASVHRSVLNQLKEKTSLAEDLKSKIDLLENKLRNSERTSNDSQLRFDSERHQLMNQMNQKEAEKKNLSNKLEDITRKLDELTREGREDKDRIQSGNKNQESQKSKLKMQEDEIEALKRERNNLLGEKKVLDMKNSGMELELPRLQKLVDSKTSELTQAENELQNKNSKINQLQKSLSDLELEKKDLQYQIKNLESSIARLTKENSEKSPKEDLLVLHEEIERLQEFIKKYSEEAQEKEEEQNQKTQEFEQLVSELEEKNSSFESQLQEWEEKYKASQDDLLKLREFSEKIICDNSILQKRVDLLKEELMNVQEGGEGNPSVWVNSDAQQKLSYQLRRLIGIVSIAV